MNVFDVSKLEHVDVGSLKGTVHGIVGDIEEERLVLVAVDKVDGFARDGVGKVFLFLDRLTAATIGLLAS